MIVTVKVPVGVAAVVLTVIWEEPEGPIGFVAKLAVVPAGRPLAFRETFDEKPPEAVDLIVKVAGLPRVTLIAAGVPDKLKFGVAGALTVSWTVFERTRLPPT